MKPISILLLLFLLWTAGCAVIGSSEPEFFAKQDFTIPLVRSHPDTLPAAQGEIDHEWLKLEIDRTPNGSYVNVVIPGQSIQGTLLYKAPKKLVLVNSMSTETIVDQDGQKCAKKSHTPFHAVETSQMTHFSILAPPSDKFAPKGMKYHADDLTLDAIKFHSGRIQHWFAPTINWTQTIEKCSPAELERELAQIPLGSQVALLDESGQTYNAIISRMGPDGLTLLNCMTQDSIPGPDGRSQLRTNCIPWLTIPIPSISRCSIVNSAPSDLAPSNDDHCDQCVADIIYKSGRHQSDWRSAQNEREVIRILTGRPKWLTFPGN